MRGVCLTLCFFVCGVGACSAFVSLDGLRVIDGGTDSGPNDASTDVAVDATMGGDSMADAAGCPTLEGPSMVAVPGAGYCIDSTEVTADQYRKFVDAKVDPSTQAARCAWNGDFAPTTMTTGSIPVVSIDWCDAFAYCAWAGKRLCGTVGGGSTAYGDFANAATSQWFRACTAQGAHLYPYGATYDPHACNGVDSEAGALVPVGTWPTCVGGYPGIFDMVGNAGEWIDSCEDGTGEAGPQEDHCHTTGGTYYWTSPGDVWTRCDVDEYNLRQEPYSDRGFRCCTQ